MRAVENRDRPPSFPSVNPGAPAVALALLLCGCGSVGLMNGTSREQALPTADSRAQPAVARTGALLATDFERAPGGGGWSYRKWRSDEVDDPWTDLAAASGSHSISAVPGFYWESPPIPVTPLEYYRIEFNSLAADAAYMGVIFYDEDGGRLLSDHYDGIDRSKVWKRNVFCVKARAGAGSMRVRFEPHGTGRMKSGKHFHVDDVRVERVSRKDVAEWADEVYATMPAVGFTPPSDRRRFIPRSMAKLRGGGELTIVLLGDSIACDIGNSAPEVLVERLFPGSRVRLVTSTRRNCGTRFYGEPDRVKRYVLDYGPDLVIIAGISNSGPGSFRNLIRLCREGSGAEIIVMNGVFGPRFRPAVEAARDKTPGPLERMARGEKVAFLDLRAAVAEYLAGCGKPYEYFLRDGAHPNARGKQIFARILEKYFAEDEE